MEAISLELHPLAQTAVILDAKGSLSTLPVPDFADESVSTEVVKIIKSYTGIVGWMVWGKI